MKHSSSSFLVEVVITNLYFGKLEHFLKSDTFRKLCILSENCVFLRNRKMAGRTPDNTFRGAQLALSGSDVVAGSLEAAYSLNWGAQEIWGKGGGETLTLLKGQMVGSQ